MPRKNWHQFHHRSLPLSCICCITGDSTNSITRRFPVITSTLTAIPGDRRRGIRVAQQAACGRYAGRSGQGQEASSRRGHRQARHATPCGDELGQAPEAGVRDRHRGLRTLRREAQGDCQHRGAGGHREDSGAPGTHGAGSVPIRAAAWGEGTATTAQSALSSKVGVLAAGL